SDSARKLRRRPSPPAQRCSLHRALYLRYRKALSGEDPIRVLDLLAIGLVDDGEANSLAVAAPGDPPQAVAGLDGYRLSFRHRHGRFRTLEGQRQPPTRLSFRPGFVRAQDIAARRDILRRRQAPLSADIGRRTPQPGVTEEDLDAGAGTRRAADGDAPLLVIIDGIDRQGFGCAAGRSLDGRFGCRPCGSGST